MKIRNSCRSFAVQLPRFRKADADAGAGHGRENLPIALRQAQALDRPVNDKQLLEAIAKLLSTSESSAAKTLAVSF